MRDTWGILKVLTFLLMGSTAQVFAFEIALTHWISIDGDSPSSLLDGSFGTQPLCFSYLFLSIFY